MFTFHHYTRGHFHIKIGLECEDRSYSYSNEDKNYHIAVVADGHGDSQCFRSGLGAEFAVNITVKHFQEFANNPNIDEDKLCEDKEYRKEKIKDLTNRIVTDWHNSVIEHFKNNPKITEKEKSILKDTNIDNLISTEKNYPHIYGTTLIAGLMLSKSLILIQQGDGRCDVFYEKDGITKVRQPIPWDPNCEGNITTSMCDSDASEKIRVSFVNLNKVKVIACYFGTDGVEDAYRDTEEDLGGSHSKMGGVHTFYKKLSCELVKRGKDDFKHYLSEMLPIFSEKGMFSRTGSGDDVSVAGIVNIEALRNNIENFTKDIEIYDLEEQLFWAKDKLKGKIYKHGILTRRLEEAAKEYQEAKYEAKRDTKNVNLLFFLKEDKERKENLCKATEKYIESEINFNEYDKTYRKIEDEIREIENQIKKVKEPDYEPQIPKLATDENCSKYENSIKDLTEEVASLRQKINDLEKQMEEAKRQAEEEARRQAEEEARRQAEEEARRQAEEEARRQAEEEARKQAEEEARRQAEEEARRQAEEEARRQAEEEARRQAEEEARKQAEEEARKQAEEEARKQAEEEIDPDSPYSQFSFPEQIEEDQHSPYSDGDEKKKIAKQNDYCEFYQPNSKEYDSDPL